MRLRAKETLAEAATRVTGSRFAKPVARLVLLALGLLGLAVLGHSAGAGATASSGAAAGGGASASAALETTASPAATAPAPSAVDSSPSSSPPVAPHGRASADDPVALNAATFEDLRRLPGVGPKRADAILALRTRLGRFRAVEDLLKVKGIGRATLKRLRPLIRLDAPSSGEGAARLKFDAGAPSPLSASAH